MKSIIESINSTLNNLTLLNAALENDPAPAADIVFTTKKKQNRLYYYKSVKSAHKRKRIYLGDAHSDKLKSAAHSAYKMELIRTVRHNIRVLKRAYDDLWPDRRADITARLSPCVRKVLFNTDFGEVMNDLRKWADSAYEKNPKPFGEKVIRAADGTRVRSKSECIFYNALLFAGIPFRYDPILHLKIKNQFSETEEYLASPDFLIKCPDGTYIIIEHAGYLSSSQYTRDLAEKLQVYQLNGYVMGVDFFVTSDTLEGGFDTPDVETLISVIADRFTGYGI